MSRGGGWGGGGGKNDAGKMGGQQLPWEYDAELEGKLNTKPSEKFPPIQPPIADPPTPSERRIVHHYRTLRARIHDGPFYAILDSRARVSKPGYSVPTTAFYDPFNGMPTYSQRFTKQKHGLPRLGGRPFVKDFFPPELHPLISPLNPNQKSSLQLSTRTKLDKFNMNLSDTSDIDDDEDDEDGVGKGAEDGGDEGEKAAADEDDEDPDQFDEEDEDDNDDYNAEQYFDGGDDDEVGDEGGGGDDDY